MKILFISMPSVHAIRWIENLSDTPFELYWYDITNKGKLETLASVKQFTNKNKRKIKNIKGEYFLSKKLPVFYHFIRPFLEVTPNEALRQIITEIRPDVIHSFEMQTCSYPILDTMRAFPEIKWMYSCWGSDLFYFQNLPEHRKKIKNVLKRVDFLHTDCQRDFDIAKELGFTGRHIGIIPGGTGFKLSELETYKQPQAERKVILVKGYQHLFGRALQVVRALEELQAEISGYKVIIFGAHQPVIDYVTLKNLTFETFGRHDLSHDELLQLAGKSAIYIGNSLSDGMPNTLLEALVMEAFPIQSNPGNATAEIITHGENGLLIADPGSISEIKEQILRALSDADLRNNAAAYNRRLAVERLEYETNKQKIIAAYNRILCA